MIHHCKAVSRGNKQAFVVGDMPFGSYEESPSLAVHNAIRLVKGTYVYHAVALLFVCCLFNSLLDWVLLLISIEDDDENE